MRYKAGIRNMIFLFLLIGNVRCQCSGSTQSVTIGYASGLIESPGYDAGYNQNLDCSWKISTSESGSSIMLQIINLYVPCSGDLVEVYNGVDNTGTSLSTSSICNNAGATRVVMIGSSGNVFLKLTTDGDIDANEKGFQVYYTSAKDFSGTGCTATQALTATTTEGYITSKNFPSPYAINTNCIWTITASDSSEHVYLEIIYMDIENDGTCQYDYLQISGHGKLCQERAWSINTNYTSVGTSFTVTFNSDNENVKQGFLLKYTQTQATTTTTTTTTSTTTTTVTTTTSANASAGASTGDSNNCDGATCVAPALVCSVVGVAAISSAVILGAMNAKGHLFGKYSVGEKNKVGIETETENPGENMEKPREKILDANENIPTENGHPPNSTNMNTDSIIIEAENG